MLNEKIGSYHLQLCAIIVDHICNADSAYAAQNAAEVDNERMNIIT